MFFETMSSSHHLHLFCSMLLLLLLSLPSSPLNIDGTLLLSFKHSILTDPLSLLHNWDYNDATPCQWTGITCAQLANITAVITISLPNSKLLGNIPQELGLIPHLKTLDLSHNFFNGNLPSSFFNASQLQFLHLSGNYLSGRIPSGAKSLQFLDLSSNLLSGSLPTDFGGSGLRYLNLSHNQLAGPVPPTFASKIPAKATIDVSFNRLSGEIPASPPLWNQKTEAYVGNTDLCGKPLSKLCTVPSSLSAPPNLTASASSSPAIAVMPKTIASTNSSAATQSGGQVTAQRGLKPAAIAGMAVVPLVAVGALAALLLYMHQKKKKKNGARKADKDNAHEFEKDLEAATVKETRNLPTWPCLTITNGEETSEGASSESDDQKQKAEQLKNERRLVMVDGESEVDVESLFKASAYVLGPSGATIVYKAVLQDGTQFAVRRVGLESTGVGKMKEFERKVKAIAKLHHQNLVRVRGFYWGEDEKLLISDYVSNGSLANVGCRKIGSSPYHLPFLTRLKIAKGVARGLSYIHDKKNVHGNIKPSNILLTADMEPIISDFGLNWLIYANQTNKSDGSAQHLGSTSSNDTGIGPAGFRSPYHAPEFLNNLKPNPKWDVYSFGVLLLQLLTGKVFSNRELSQWTPGSKADDPVRVMRMADVAIRGDVVGQEKAMLAWLKLGFRCASLLPQKRPCMRDALRVLEKIPCL